MSTARNSFDDEETPKRPLHLKAMLHRRRWWVVLTLLSGLAAAVAVAYALPDVYRSSATILIERQQIPDELVRSTVTSELGVRLQTISQEILSRSRLESLVEQFGLYPEMRGRQPVERIVERMRGDIDVQMRGGDRRRSGGSTVAFSVGYRGSDPQKVATVANAIASFYIEENLKARERQATGTADFLRVQMEQLRAKLEEQEAEVSAFKEEHLGELPQQLDANLKTLEQLNGQLRLNSDNQVQANARRAAVEEQLSQALGAVGGGPDAYAAHLAALRRQLAELRTRYTDQYPDVIRVKDEIARLEAVAAAGGDSSAGQSVVLSPQIRQLQRSLDEADVQLVRLRAEADRLRDAIARYQRRVEAAPRREQEFYALSREYKSTQEQYRSLVARHNEAQLAESMEQRQKGELFRVIEPALAEARPSAPNRGRLLMLSLLVSLALALGVAFVREMFDPAVHSQQDVEACASLPVLVSVPVLTSAVDRERQRRRLALGAVLALVGLVAVMGASYGIARGNTALASWVSR